jgi:hypothetical protein
MKPISLNLYALAEMLLITGSIMSFHDGQFFHGILDLSIFGILVVVSLLSWKTFTNT